jgi:hypothetical protein
MFCWNVYAATHNTQGLSSLVCTFQSIRLSRMLLPNLEASSGPDITPRDTGQELVQQLRSVQRPVSVSTWSNSRSLRCSGYHNTRYEGLKASAPAYIDGIVSCLRKRHVPGWRNLKQSHYSRPHRTRSTMIRMRVRVTKTLELLRQPRLR